MEDREDGEKKAEDGRRLAQAELTWFYAESGAAIGFASFDPEGGGGGAVWDDARIHRLHMRMRSTRRRGAAARLREVGPTVAQLTPDEREIAALAFTPRALPVEVRLAFTVRKGVILAALAAARSPSARALRDRKKAAEPLLEFLAWECASASESKRLPARILKVRDEAEAILLAVLDRYAALLEERAAEHRRERESSAPPPPEPEAPLSHAERVERLDALVRRMRASGGER